MKSIYPKDAFKALTDTSPMVDRWLAYAAGLGFFGRNHCLIHPLFGSYVTIGAILTTLPLTPDKPSPFPAAPAVSAKKPARVKS